MIQEDDRMKSPIFIGGTGRSGTTIIAKMLGRHSQIYTYPLETRFIIDPDGLIDLVPALSTQWSPYIGSKAIKRFKYMMHALGKNRTQVKRGINYILKKCNFFPQRYEGIQLAKIMGKKEYENTVNTFIDQLIDTEFKGYWCGTDSFTIHPTIISPKRFQKDDMIQMCSRFIHELFGLALKRQNKLYFVDHTPYNILHANFLKELFPGLKLIHVYRDMRDVICSYKTKKWGGNESRDVVFRLKQIYLCWNEIKETLPGDNYYEMKLESVIQNPGSELKHLFRFLNIEFEKNSLDMDLSKGHVGRWIDDLNKEEKSFIKKEFKHIMEQYGYRW
jgi:hypothetical protein